MLIARFRTRPASRAERWLIRIFLVLAFAAVMAWLPAGHASAHGADPQPVTSRQTDPSSTTSVAYRDPSPSTARS